MFKVSAHYVITGTEMVSHFVDSSVNDVLLQTNPDFTSHFLNSSTFLKIIWLTGCCTTVKHCIRLAVRGHRSKDTKLIEVFFISMHIWFVFVFQVVQKHTLSEVVKWPVI